jgi:hypothetical protein
MATCPNVNLDSWKNLVAARGEDVAYYLWDLYEGNVPESESKSEIVKAGLKATNALQSDKGIQLFNTLVKNKVTGDAFWNKIQSDLQIPKEQIDLLKSFKTTDRNELITNMLANYSFAIEIDIAKVAEPSQFAEYASEESFSVDGSNYDMLMGFDDIGDITDEVTYLKDNEEISKKQYFDAYEKAKKNVKPASFYSNLTVPGGTNYTENEIGTPEIIPNIKGHAQFATKNGIGWFRSDDQVEGGEFSKDEWVKNESGFGERLVLGENITVGGKETKTRRILELQSDLFQKGRDEKNIARDMSTTDLSEQQKKLLREVYKEKGEDAYNNLYDKLTSGNTRNQFLQLLNKANNWVTFFIKSIIQDSAKKGYEKVLFPTGSTAYKVESGGNTVEDYIKNKEDRLEEIEEEKIKNKNKIGTKVKDDFTGSEYVYTEFNYEQDVENRKYEIDQLKREIENAKKGSTRLAATARFYEEAVANVLKKQGYTPKQIKDEYGNTWNEITISKDRDQQAVLFQTEDMSMSKASEQTLNKIKEAAKKMGIDIQALTDYAKANPDVDLKSVNGVADLVKGVVAIATGMEKVALTEEMVHIATAILEQTNPKLVTQMISKIDRFQIYKQTLDAYKGRKSYQLPDGKPDIRKIKKEAVDKLIAEVIINRSEGSTEFPELMREENRSFIKDLWNTILDIIKGMYRSSNINIFEEVAAKITGEEAIGTVAYIKTGGVFLQTKNDLVDKMYNSIVDMDKRLKIVVVPGSGGKEGKRFYTQDGEGEIPSVTQVIKKDSKMPDRTGLLKEQDDQMRDWGIEGHNYIDNYISDVLVDENGYKRKTPTNVKVVTKLNDSVREKIEQFATELINSYPEGTRFLLEKKVINERVKGKLASTIDFIAIEPVIINGKEDVKVDVLDWKFSNINKANTDDIPWYKQGEWKAQMGEYAKVMVNYGLKANQIRKARMIPFISNYNYKVIGEPSSGLVLNSIEIGKLDSAQETKLYLLPVPLDSELTPSSKVDALLKSLRQQYDKMFEFGSRLSPKEKFAKDIQLNKLSEAIRTLHVKLDFGPLVLVGKNFLQNAAKSFKDFENIDYSKLTVEDIENKLKDLIEFKKSAEKFSTLDDVFLSAFPKEGLDDEAKKTLASLEQVAASTGRMIEKINELQRDYVVQLALKEGLTTEETKLSVLDAQKQVDVISKTFLEGSKLSSKIIKLASNLIMNAKSLMSIKVAKAIDDFTPLLLDLEKEASAKGVSAFSLIGQKGEKGLSLIKKIDKGFWDKLTIAKQKKDKQFLLDNMDVAEYNRLAKEAIEKGTEEMNNTIFSTDPQTDAEQRAFRIKKLKDSLDINSETFNGYEGRQFAYLFNEALIEEPHYSREYKDMARSPAALKMWEYMVGLNQKARDMGYITGKTGNSFFPLMEATMIERLTKTNNLLFEAKDLFTDGFTVRVNEEQTYSKTDPETNQIKRKIPKLFTRTDKNADQLSTDLNKVLSLWTKALLEYDANRKIENTLLTLHAVEKSKGAIMVDENQNIIFEGGVPKVDLTNLKNADALEVIIDDAIYGLRENVASLGNVVLGTTVSKFGKGTEEEKENTKLSVKKTLENSNKLTQALAVGLKLLVAIPNYFGVNFQAFINAGSMYRFREFEKNNAKITTGIGLSTIEKGLLDLVVPLNDDVTEEKRRALAKKQSYMKWLSTWTFTDVMMVTNSAPEKKLQLANAMSFNDNSMVINGRIVNIRQHLRKQDRERYKTMPEAERRALEKTFQERVDKLKESSSLTKIAKIENDRVVIPGVSEEELSRYRTKIIEYGRNLTGQMNNNNRADYRRDSIFKSFMMFKNWIPKQLYVRTGGIQKNLELDEWEYGRTRLFVKTWAELGLWNIGRMKDIIQGTDKGLQLMKEMYDKKKEEHFIKTGEQLEITEEEFYDLVRRELSNQMKELGLLFGILAVLIAAKLAAPDDDEDDLTKNKYKYFLKLTNKITDELAFYYNPTSFESITKGSVLPSIGLLVRAEKVISHVTKEIYGYASDNEELMEKAHPTKYFLDLIPGPSQFNKEVLPIIDPELAKELGIRVTSEVRR